MTGTTPIDVIRVALDCRYHCCRQGFGADPKGLRTGAHVDDIERYSITSIGVVPVILERMARGAGLCDS